MEIAGLHDLTVVGRGGFGVVYRARQVALNRDVAVKVLPAVGVSPDALSRFERECQALGSMSGHPNIVALYGTGHTADGSPYLVMDYLSGGSLAERTLPLGRAEAVRIAVEIAGALETAHRAGIVHRDVKPENILISGFGKAQLADFGIATLAGGFESRSGNITASLAHAAPEVLSGQRATPLADVYSLGSTLFQLLFGRPAFVRQDDDTIGAIVSRVAVDPVPDLRADGIPDELAIVVERAMRKEPTLRPASAQAFAAELQGAARALGYPIGEFVVGPEVVVAPTGAEPVVAMTTPASAPVFVPAPETAPQPELAVAPVPPDRRRQALIAAIAVVAVLILIAVAALALGGSDGTTSLVTDPGTTTSTSSPDPGTTTTIDLTSTTAVDPTSTTDPNATTTTGPATTLGPGPTLGPGTTLPPTLGTTAKPVTTTAPVAPPAQPTNLHLTSVSASGADKPATVGVALAWSAPSGGGPVQGYQLVQLSMIKNFGTGTSAVDHVVATIDVGNALGFSGQFAYSDRLGEWFQWELRAYNTSAAGVRQLSLPLNPGTTPVPAVVGAPVNSGAARVRMSGFAVDFFAECKDKGDYVIRKQVPTGGSLTPGSTVDLQQDTPEGSGPCS